MAGPRVEPESGSRSGKDPTGVARLAVRERGRGEHRVGQARPREGKKLKAGWAGPCGRKGREGKKRVGQLGRGEKKK
jgi:hypothetical protein